MSPAEPAWPRPRINLSACAEAAWRWWLAVLCGLLLLAAMLTGLQRTQAQGLREARLEIALQSLRERLETHLALGFELADSQQAQAMLEDLLADDPTLLSAEVFDASAISLFNTDRGAIGERVPGDWLQASSTGSPMAGGPAPDARAWSVMADDGFTLGLPIRGPFGELAGHVSITSAFPPAPASWPVLLATAVVALGMTLTALLLARLMLRALAARRDDAAMAAAAARLRAAEQRIDDALDELKQAREPA